MLAAPQCSELIVSARSRDKLEEIVRDNQNTTSHPLDVTETGAVLSTANEIKQDGASPDLVVICSGIWEQTQIPGLDPEVFRKTMETNFLGAINVISAVAPAMAERGSGHIAIVASVAGYRGLPNAAAYAPTKAALINLAECIKPQLARMGITISIVNPGFVETRLTAVNKFPMPFIQTAKEAAELIMKGLLQKKYEIAFPLRLVLILKLMRALPNRLFFWLVDRIVLR